VKDLSHTVTINDYWLWEAEEDEALLTDEAFDERLERQDFLGWLELWVDSDFDADFFKDYE